MSTAIPALETPAQLVVFAIGLLYQRYRHGGRILYAIGGNAEVARLAGINVKRATVLVYVVCSALAGLSGMVLAARLDSVQPSSGVSYELDAIAAVVNGDTLSRLRPLRRTPMISTPMMVPPMPPVPPDSEVPPITTAAMASSS